MYRIGSWWIGKIISKSTKLNTMLNLIYVSLLLLSLFANPKQTPNKKALDALAKFYPYIFLFEYIRLKHIPLVFFSMDTINHRMALLLE